MRKLVCLFAVICIAAPAFAGDIAFTVSSSVDKQFTIAYAATDPAEGPVGIGLKVTVTGACSGSVSGAGNVVATDPCFSVFIDWAHDMADPNDYTVNPGPAGQHPLADPCGAGVPDPCSTVFSICMGRLDPCNLPPQAADLVTLQLDCDADCTVTVTIEEDGLRGGIVGAAWGTLDASDSTSVVCTGGGPLPCVIPCWDYDSQCHGDVDGDDDVDTVDWPTFRDAFGKAYPAAGYNPCGDMDHDGDVDTVDWPSFRDNFGSGNVANDCPMTCVWPPI
jgi:hypothetical protein